jgi:8-oxo-dGTP pyrophosphatase MutT (NUDIX family)
MDSTAEMTAPGVRIKNKTSFGVACCRHDRGQMEVLMVCKRFTYAFNIFVHGRYCSNSNADLIALFNGMTIDEKYDILSLNFMQIWYRIFLTNIQHNASYFLAKNKFESTFLVDNGARLKKLVAKSTHAAKIWEIPKGKKRNKIEPDIHCAIREFYEETGIPKKTYKIYPQAVKTNSYIDEGVKYTNIYYIAFTRHNINPRVDLLALEQLKEISDIRWMGINEMRFVDSSGRLERLARPIFNFVKKQAKK